MVVGKVANVWKWSQTNCRNFKPEFRSMERTVDGMKLHREKYSGDFIRLLRIICRNCTKDMKNYHQNYTANKFPEMILLIPKQNYNVSQFLHSYICERFIYFQDRSILLQPNTQTDLGNISIAHRHMIVGIETAAAHFLFWEYINWIFGTVQRAIHYTTQTNYRRAIFTYKPSD